MAFYSLKTIIPKNLRSNKIAPAICASVVCSKMNKIIIDIIGSSATGNTKAVYVKTGTVTIESRSSQIISELKLYETAIIETLNLSCPNTKIKALHFVTKS